MAVSKASKKTANAASDAAGQKKKAVGGKAKPSATENKGREKTTRKKPGPTPEGKSDGLTKEAMRIVEQAASILEEEIAAGIVAAKKVEERYVNVNALRSGAPEQVIQRFRKDAHEVLDILLDLVNLSVSALGGLSERAMNIRGAASPKEKTGAKPEDTLPELVLPAVLKPGESGKVGMLVENDSDKATGRFEFVTAGLLSPSGDRLDAEHIGFEPPVLEVAANDVEKVNVTVFIPEGTPPGHYSGLVLAPAIHMRAILTVHVEA